MKDDIIPVRTLLGECYKLGSTGARYKEQSLLRASLNN